MSRAVIAIVVVLAACGGSPSRPPAPVGQAPTEIVPASPVHAVHTVLLVGDENLYLEGALAALDLEVTRFTADAYTNDPSAGDAVDVAIFIEGSPKVMPRANAIVFRPNITWSPVRVHGEVQAPRVTKVAAHRVTRDLELADVRIDTSRDFDVGGDSVALVWSNTEVIIAAKREPTRKTVLVGFALTVTDLPMRTAFPLLLANTFAWFAE